MKRWRKQKAAQQQAKHRKRPASPGSSSAAGGTMSSMRSGLRRFLGGRDPARPKGPAEKVLDFVLWVAVLIAALYFLQNRCMR